MEIHKRGQKNKNHYDTIWFGFLSGLLVPAVIMLLFWYVKYYPALSLGDFLTVQFKPEAVMKIISLCAFPDLGVFYLFSRKNWNNACRGMILAIIALIVMTLVIKF